MKKLIFLLVAGFLASQPMIAQNITAHVYGSVYIESENNMVPVPQHPVTIMIYDSLNGSYFIYENTVYTDYNGYYEDLVSIPPANTFLFVQAMTYDSCMGDYQYQGYYLAPGTTLPPMDFFLCGSIFPPGCENFFTYYFSDSTTVTFEGFLLNGQIALEYSWEFGDGVSATGQFVTHTYSEPGFYVVTLQTIDSTGCTFQTWMEVCVGNVWPGCTNMFYYEQTDSTTFTFTGEAFLNNGTVSSETTFYWDFGDGTTGTGQTITHDFQPNPVGGYLVCLETYTPMSDGDTCIAYSCQEVLMVPPIFGIYGYVLLGNNMTADQGLVRLMTLDTLWQNVIELETTLIDSGGFYIFPNVPMYDNRLYFIQAELTEGSAYYGDYLPTYHLNSLTWEDAFPVLPLMNWTADVWMIPAATLNSGNGEIKGTVVNLGSRNTIDDVLVVLLDSEMTPYYYIRSAEDGSFGFTDLPMGTYVIHAEITGIHTNPAIVTLSEGQTEINLEIQIHGNEAFVVYGIGEGYKNIEKISEVYPNPVSAVSRIDLTLKHATVLEISVINYSGHNISTLTGNFTEGTHSIQLESESLPAGIYLLNIKTSGGDQANRRFIKH